MCMQCAAAAMGSVSGIRALLRTHAGAWLTPGRMKAVTIALVSLGVIVSAFGLGGSG